MGWVDPWVGLGRDFSVFGGLGWVHYRKSHWRQPRRGCRGHIPQYFGWGGRQREYSPYIITYFRI